MTRQIRLNKCVEMCHFGKDCHVGITSCLLFFVDVVAPTAINQKWLEIEALYGFYVHECLSLDVSLSILILHFQYFNINNYSCVKTYFSPDLIKY